LDVGDTPHIEENVYRSVGGVLVEGPVFSLPFLGLDVEKIKDMKLLKQSGCIKSQKYRHFEEERGEIF